MDKKFLKVPVAIFVLAFITTIFILAPLFFFFNQLNRKLDRIDLQLYQQSSYQPVSAPSSATQSASSSGKAK